MPPKGTKRKRADPKRGSKRKHVDTPSDPNSRVDSTSTPEVGGEVSSNGNRTDSGRRTRSRSSSSGGSSMALTRDDIPMLVSEIARQFRPVNDGGQPSGEASGSGSRTESGRRTRSGSSSSSGGSSMALTRDDIPVLVSEISRQLQPGNEEGQPSLTPGTFMS